MGRTWPVGTASGIGAIAGGAATDWIGASSSMDGFGRIGSDGRGLLSCNASRMAAPNLGNYARLLKLITWMIC
uniref:Uncharacterized protein n=1 Tax=Oryza meridionalis TaxID=40149 RepID=A0A0E0D0S1_9ORYZ